MQMDLPRGKARATNSRKVKGWMQVGHVGDERIDHGLLSSCARVDRDELRRNLKAVRQNRYGDDADGIALARGQGRRVPRVRVRTCGLIYGYKAADCRDVSMFASRGTMGFITKRTWCTVAP